MLKILTNQFFSINLFQSELILKMFSVTPTIKLSNFQFLVNYVNFYILIYILVIAISNTS